MITEQQLTEWERLAAEATPGPWVTKYPFEQDSSACYKVPIPQSEADTDFINAAREAVPALIEEVRRLEKENRQLRERWADKVVKEAPKEWGGAEKLAEAEAEVRRLKKERDSLEETLEAVGGASVRMKKTNDALRAKLDRIREAVEPMVKFVAAYDKCPGGWDEVGGMFTVEDFRALADAIKEEECQD